MNEYEKIFEVFKKDYDHENPNIPRTREFQNLVKSYIRNEIGKRGLCYVNYNPEGYCEASGYVTDGRKYCYYNTGDFRYNVMGPWQDNILIRVGDSMSGCQGGQNHFCKLENIGDAIQNLLRAY